MWTLKRNGKWLQFLISSVLPLEISFIRLGLAHLSIILKWRDLCAIYFVLDVAMTLLEYELTREVAGFAPTEMKMRGGSERKTATRVYRTGCVVWTRSR